MPRQAGLGGWHETSFCRDSWLGLAAWGAHLSPKPQCEFPGAQQAPCWEGPEWGGRGMGGGEQGGAHPLRRGDCCVD